MLHHIVLFRFNSKADEARIAALTEAFAALRRQVPGVLSLRHGPDVSPEGLQKGFTHAWLLTFADAVDRDAYLVHPAHQAFFLQVKPFIDDVLVVDFTSD